MALRLLGHLHLPEDMTLYARLRVASMTGSCVPCRLRLPWTGQEADVDALVIALTKGPEVDVTFQLEDPMSAAAQMRKE